MYFRLTDAEISGIIQNGSNRRIVARVVQHGKISDKAFPLTARGVQDAEDYLILVRSITNARCDLCTDNGRKFVLVERII